MIDKLVAEETGLAVGDQLTIKSTQGTETEGQLLIDGQDLGKMNDIDRTSFRRKNIGFTFQSNNLVPYLSAVENLELMLRLNKENKRNGRKRAVELLTRLGLEDRLNNFRVNSPEDSSSGWRSPGR